MAYFKNRSNLSLLEEQNLELKNQILKLKNIISNQEDLVEENKHLKKMLSLKEEYTTTLIPATIISKNPWNWNKEILIDKGTLQGIGQNDLIIDFDACLVGRVERTTEHQAWIRLLSDPNFKVICRCRSLNTILVGALFEGAKLLYVPYDLEIETGDEVIIPDPWKSGLKIKIGKVSFAKKSRSQLTQSVFVKPYADLNNLRQVFVLKSH
ncbi:MAG: rod shape-determining protein MreC [Candidatus Omnitrophica bacterium]|nr:rod shape-determining protein MreC [Candidatus Omnitrophota bacterium]